MKKLLTLALVLSAIFGAGAQKATVEQAKKLAGKTDKLTEARTLIQQAMENPETAQDPETYYVAGKIEWDAYDKDDQVGAVNPELINPVDQVTELINGYYLYKKMFPLDELPNEKGQVKPKYSKEVRKKIAGKADDFFQAGAVLYGLQAYYPWAYESFMIYGDLPGEEFMGKDAPQVPDTVRATSYFNAGLCAWTAGEVNAAAEAFKRARLNNYTDPNACIYEIACWQNIEQTDSTRVNEAKVNILEAARDGYQKFGMSQPVFINNMVNSMLNSNQEAQALQEVNNAISQYPDMAALYGLRGFVYERMGNDDASEADYRQAAEMPDVDFDTMRNAIRKVYRIGQEKWNEIELGDPQIREKKEAVRKNYFEVAKKYAEKANELKPGDPDIDYLIENIDYQLSL